MTLTQLAQKHNLEPESAKAFLREWVDAQPIIAQAVTHMQTGHQRLFFGNGVYDNHMIVVSLIASPTDLGE